MDLAGILAASLPPALTPPSGRWLLEQASARLPRSHGGLAVECHLTAERPRADLVARVFPADRDAYLRQEVGGEPHVAHFFRAWLEDPALRHIPYADLECDIEGGPAPPFIGPMIDPYLPGGERALEAARSLGARADPPPSSYAVAERVVRAFAAAPPSDSVLKRMADCYDRLPRGGFICHLTSLTTRASKPEDAVRLIVSLPRASLEGYLASVGYRADVAALRAWLALHRARSPRVDLDLDVDSRGPRSKLSVYATSWPLSAGSNESAVELARLGVPSDRAAAVGEWLAWQPPAGLPPRSLTIKRTFSDNVSAGIKAYLSLLHPTDPHARGAQARRFA